MKDGQRPEFVDLALTVGATRVRIIKISNPVDCEAKCQCWCYV